MKLQPIPVIVHTACDTEAYAAAWNDGYESAVTQGLADDPTLADDWFQEKLREARAQALEEVAAHIEPSGVLWWGDRGVTVAEPGRPTRWTKITDWLRARAAAERDQEQ